MARSPRVFVSYSYDSPQHRGWVKDLAVRLRSDGVDCRLDVWDLRDSSISEFMAREVRRADKVLVVCTPEYQAKVHAAEDGLAPTGTSWEAMLLINEMYVGGVRGKVVPVLARGAWRESAPLFLQSLRYFDLSDADWSEPYLELVAYLLQLGPEAPPLGMPLSPPGSLEGRQVLHNLPQYPMGFLDRAEAQGLLRDSILGDAEENRTRRVAVTGLPGIGKSTLALAFAWEHRQHFESISWIDASLADPMVALGSVAESTFELGLSADVSIAERARAVRQRLAQGGPHLLVLDDLDRPLEIAQLLGSSAETRVIATTRLDVLPGFPSVSLGTLRQGDALKLLGFDSEWSSTERDAALRLGERFEWLTQALAVAGDKMRASSWWPSKLLARIEREGGPIAWSEANHLRRLSSEGASSLVALFDASFDLLDEEDSVDALAKQVFFMAGWLGAEPVPPLLFRTTATDMDGGDPDYNRLEDAFARLVDVGLALIDLRGGLRLHALVAEYARLRGGSSMRNAALSLLGREACALPPNALTVPIPGLGGLILADLEPHLRACMRLEIEDWPDVAGWIPFRLAEYYAAGGEARQAIETLEEVATSAQAESWRGRYHSLIGRLSLGLGDVDAAQAALESAVSTLQRSCESCDEERVRATLALADILAAQQRSADAWALLEPICESCAAVSDPSPLGTRIRESAAHVRWEQGDFKAAIEHQLAAVEIEAQAPVVDYEIRAPASEALIEMLTAVALDGQHQFQATIANGVDEAIDPGVAKAVAAAQHAAGHALMSEGRFVEALPYLEAALERARDLPEPDARDIGATQFAVGVTLLGLNRATEAATHLEGALAIAVEVFPEGHPLIEETRIRLLEARNR